MRFPGLDLKMTACVPLIFPLENDKNQSFHFQPPRGSHILKTDVPIYSRLVHDREMSFHLVSAIVSVCLCNTGTCSVPQVIQEA